MPDTRQESAVLRNYSTARKVRAAFPVGTRVRGRVGGMTGTVQKHVPLADAHGGVLYVLWDNGHTGRHPAGTVQADTAG